MHIKCETDFSAKSEQFQTFVDSLTANVSSNGVDAVDGCTQELDDLRLSIKENVEVGKVEVVEAEEGNLIDVYLHKQDGRGANGVIVEGKGVDQETLHQVALHSFQTSCPHSGRNTRRSHRERESCSSRNN